jgi:hypothetical protein
VLSCVAWDSPCVSRAFRIMKVPAQPANWREKVLNH